MLRAYSRRGVALVCWRDSCLPPSAAESAVALQQDMDTGRRERLLKLGFDPEAAEGLSALHTRNFM